MSESLVSCDWLKSQIEGRQPRDLVILDVSWSSSQDCHSDYSKDHIPGSVYFNVFDIAVHTELHPRNIPNLDVFQKAARDAGINNTSHVVIYSNTDFCSFFISGRVWWTFKIWGHPKVSVLNGGLQKWKSLGYPTTANTTDIQVGNFQAKWTPSLYRTFEEFNQALSGQKIQVCDSRGTEKYAEHGHIPGARNIPLSSLMDEERKEMKSVEEVKKLFAGAGVDLTQPIVTHCNSGMSSCSLAFAAHLCGNTDVAVFHGGFTEWKTKASDRVDKSS
ncbi:thiosulfate sulfurtransferase-like [Haliotis rubra]|uniref:thiosulfate sulfurtransferase-like n=1 Tax=Haliotis rubra TaxID=36100 RepID=UPI001EE60EE2|nr:thiosulfate sulfurtransferase-like [Haliotis rubra]